MSASKAAGASGKARRGASRATAPLALGADLGIEQAASLRADLAARLDEAGPVTLDGAEVQRVHTAAMQLFCLFCGDRRKAGRDTVWHRPSPALRSAAALLGVNTLLEIARENA